MHRGDLCRRRSKGLQFVPEEKARTSTTRGLHDEIGHWSFATTCKIVSDRLWWQKIRTDFAHFVRSCYSNQNSSPSEQNGPYRRMPVSGLFHTWSFDFARLLNETATGNKYILLAAENLSSCPVASAIGSNYLNSSGVIKVVEEHLCHLYGNPIRILSGGDPNFDSAAVRDYASSASIDWKIISAYNPRGKAKVKRMVRMMKRATESCGQQQGQ